MNNHPIHYFIFRLAEQLFAITVSDVERVFRALWVTPIPDSPPLLRGVVNLRGRVLPVFNLHSRLELPEKAVDTTDRLVLLPGQFSCCFFVDHVEGVLSFHKEEIFPPTRFSAHLEQILEGIVQYRQETVLLLPIRHIVHPLLAQTQPLLQGLPA